MLPDALVVVDILAGRFDSLGITYLIGGSIASSMYGIWRSTNNVDMVIVLQPEKIDALFASLQDEFYVDADMIHAAVANYSSFNVIHLPTMVKADIFVPKPAPFRESVWRRRRLERIRPEDEMQAVYVASPEDMVLQKLE